MNVLRCCVTHWMDETCLMKHLDELLWYHAGVAQSHMVAVLQCDRVNEFHFAKVAIGAEDCQEYFENDLVLLSKEQV